MTLKTRSALNSLFPKIFQTFWDRSWLNFLIKFGFKGFEVLILIILWSTLFLTKKHGFKNWKDYKKKLIIKIFKKYRRFSFILRRTTYSINFRISSSLKISTFVMIYLLTWFSLISNRKLTETSKEISKFFIHFFCLVVRKTRGRSTRARSVALERSRTEGDFMKLKVFTLFAR